MAIDGREVGPAVERHAVRCEEHRHRPPAVPRHRLHRFHVDLVHVRPLEEIEIEAIRFAITHYRGQMSEVARRLRIGRSTLYRKLDEIGLSGELRSVGQVERRLGEARRLGFDTAVIPASSARRGTTDVAGLKVIRADTVAEAIEAGITT